jgi:hypothetical protein
MQNIFQYEISHCPSRRGLLRMVQYSNFLYFYIVRIILPFLYGCETWCLTWREERRLRIFVNSVLRKMLGPRGKEVRGGWRKLNKKGLNDFYRHLTNIIYVIKSMICDGRSIWQLWGRSKMFAGFCCGNLKRGTTWKT